MIYVHTKTGNEYKFLKIARHAETLEDMAVYESVRGGEVWVRPTSEFFDGRFVTKEKFERTKLDEARSAVKTTAVLKPSSKRND